MREAVFSKTIGEFTQEHGIALEDYEIADETPLSQIPHKRDKMPGAGIVSTTVDIGQCKNTAEVFSALDDREDLQNTHRLCFIENDNGAIRMPLIHGGVKEKKSAHVLPGAERNPNAWALSDDLRGKQVTDIFKKPVGMIFRAITGINLEPVLYRQNQIFHLIDRGVSVDTIRKHLSSEAEFVEFVREEMKNQQLQLVELAGRPSTRPNAHPEFLTFNLARAWGKIPPEIKDIENAMLETQALVRAAEKLKDYKAGVRHADRDKIGAETGARAAVILEDAKSKTENVFRAQQLDKAIEAAILQDDGKPKQEFVHAVSTLMNISIKAAAQSWREMAHPGLAGEIERLAQPFRPGPHTMEPSAAEGHLSDVIDPMLQAAPAVKARHAAALQATP